MPAAKPKPIFVRSEIPRGEQLLGAGILAVLIAAGVGVAIKGRIYDPAKFSVDPATLEFSRAEVTGKAGTLRGVDSMPSGAALPDAAAGPGELALAVAGLPPLGPTEHYLDDTLYEKINGRAPTYSGFGFEELTFRSFGIADQPGQYLDVYVFTMNTPVNAFGIFSLERGSEGQPVEFVPDGYRSEMGYFLRQGRAYVQVLASDTAETVMAMAEQAARILAAQIPVDDAGIAAKDQLPADGQIPGSVSFVRQNAYGQAVLNNVFTARYAVDGHELEYFAMVAGAGQADPAFQALLAFFRDFGAVRESGETAGRPFFVGESFGQFSVIHADAQTVAGVMNADDLDAARTFVDRVLADSPPAAVAPAAPAAAPAEPPPTDTYEYEY